MDRLFRQKHKQQIGIVASIGVGGLAGIDIGVQKQNKYSK